MGRQLSNLVHHLRRSATRGAHGEETDVELLRRFAADRDALAFEALILRHGPMVLGVCRRTLGCAADAEDAFQATFLVLVRHARAVRSRESLAGWLHRVARRVSTRLVRDTARRTARERRAARPEAAPEHSGPSDWWAMLDREIERLPAVYRDAFVLCHLQGRPQPDAARELGCPVGTLQSRLARAKARLRASLAARGLGLPAGHAVTVPAALMTATVSAAAGLAGGVPSAAAAVAVALSQEVGNMMGLFKAKLVLLALAATATLGPAIGYVGQPTAAPTACPASPAPAIEDLKKENERLRREVAVLQKKLAAVEARLPNEQPPSDQEVLRALSKLRAEGFRDDIVIVKQKILDRLDPPRQFPGVGQARLRVQHWECSAYYTETLELPWPWLRKVTRSRVAVVYIDKDELVPTKGEGK